MKSSQRSSAGDQLAVPSLIQPEDSASEPDDGEDEGPESEDEFDSAGVFPVRIGFYYSVQ